MKPLRSMLCLLLAVMCVCSTACAEKESALPVQATTTLVTTTTTVITTTTTMTVKSTISSKMPTTTALPQPIVLDPTYSRLLLVNAQNPIPADFNKDGDFATLDKKYINGSLNQVDKGIYPYVISLIEAARADGVTLYVRSPYRSYNTQSMLFKNKVNAVIEAGTPADQAEAVAARAVARPGTSEHQTGLAIDFNVASSTFENSPGFKWMKEHAEDYGFILRYPKDKTAITGIMYEAWHWRFVGINVAKEMNSLGLTLEEYLAQKDSIT